MSDLDATVAWAKKIGKFGEDRVAITGVCRSGRIAWLYAARGNVKTAAAWYGKISHPTNANQTKRPLDSATSLEVSALGPYGGKDAGIPVSHVELLRTRARPGKGGLGDHRLPRRRARALRRRPSELQRGRRRRCVAEGARVIQQRRRTLTNLNS